MEDVLDVYEQPSDPTRPRICFAEIELSVLVRQCLDRRIPSLQALEHEPRAWQEERNQAAIQINWTFTTTKARVKLHRHYENLCSKN